MPGESHIIDGERVAQVGPHRLVHVHRAARPGSIGRWRCSLCQKKRLSKCEFTRLECKGGSGT